MRLSQVLITLGLTGSSFYPEIMGQTMPDVTVEETDQGTIGQQGKQGPNVDGVQVTADQKGNHHDDDWRDKVDQLGHNDPIMAVEKAEDVGRIIVGVHDQVGPLVDGDGAAEGCNPDETHDSPDEEW